MLRRHELLVLVLVFAASLPAVTPRLYSSDEVQYFSYLRSLWFDHDVSFENEYRYFHARQIAQTPDFYETFLERQTPAGRRINFATIGSAILWAPFYGVADVSTRIMRASGSAVPADGFSTPYVAAVAYGSAFYAFAAVLLGVRAARLITGQGALFAGAAIWFGTPLLFYMYVAPPFSHACSAFAVALFVTVWLQVRGAWSVPGAIALGLAGALVAMVREQDAFFAVAPAVDFALTAARARAGAVKHSVLAAAAGCAAFAVGILPQLLAYQALNGHPSPSRYVARKMYWHAPHALKVLVDPEHGFFIWTPLAVLAVAGLILLAVRPPFRLQADATVGEPRSFRSGQQEAPDPSRGFRPSPHEVPDPSGGFRLQPEDPGRIGACLLLMLALQVYVSGAVDSWSVAGAFGQRRFVALSAILIVGLAALYQRVSRRTWGKALLVVTAAVCIYWNLALTALFGTRMMDRQRMEPRRNAYDAFVTLPRLGPPLVWRYFTQRDSFYRSSTTESNQ